MLKILFFLLLMINGGLFAFQHGYLDDWMPSNREPARVKQQLNPNKLQLLPAVNANADAALTATSATETQPEEKPSAKVAVVEAQTALAKTVVAVEQAMAANTSVNASITPKNAACTEIGNFDAAEAKRFETRLAALAIKGKVKRRPISDSVRHVVYIPAQESRAAAEKKAIELKNLGVDDFFIIQEETPLQWGISLGVFKTEEAARKHLADLNKKGVRSARISDRDSSAGKVAFQLSAINADTLVSLRKIKADFPRQEIRSCNAAE